MIKILIRSSLECSLALLLLVSCASADIVVGVGRNTLPTTATTVDITDANIGGETVKGGFIIASFTENNAGTVATQAVMSMGVFDGTNEAVVVSRMVDAVSTSRSDRRGASDEVAMTLNNAGSNPTVQGEADFSAIITNGVRIDASSNPFALAHEVMAVLFAGDDVQAVAGNVSTAASVGINTTVGFAPDIVLFFYNDTGIEDTSSEGWARMYLGAAIPGSTEHSVGFSSQDNVSTTANGTHFSTTDAMIEISSAGAKLNTLACTTYTNGFTVTGSASGWGEEVLYLALKFTDGDVWIGTSSVPATASTETTSGIGFTPQAVILGLTNTTVNTNTEGIAMGISAFTSGVEIAHFWHDEDNQGTSDTGTLVDDAVAVRTTDHGGASADVATFSSFASGEFTLSYSAVDTGQSDFLAVAIGEYTGGGGGGATIPVILDSLRRRH